MAEVVFEGRERADDPRSVRSRQLLRGAAVRLLRQGSDPQPSVSTLVRTARVSRSTFYAHYDSVDELLDEALGGVSEFVIPVVGRPLGFVPALFDQVGRHPELATALLAPGRHTDYAPRLKYQVVRALTAGGLGDCGLAGDVVADAVVSALRWWLDVCPERPAEAVAAEFTSLWNPVLAASCGGSVEHGLH